MTFYAKTWVLSNKFGKSVKILMKHTEYFLSFYLVTCCCVYSGITEIQVSSDGKVIFTIFSEKVSLNNAMKACRSNGRYILTIKNRNITDFGKLQNAVEKVPSKHAIEIT